MKYSKYIFGGILIVLALSFAVTNQFKGDIQEPLQAAFWNTAAASTNYNGAQQVLTTSTSLDTVDFDMGSFNSARSYELQVNADSVSGATGATCTLQLNMDQQGTDWVALESTVVNGVTTRTLETGTLVRGTVRCRCIAPSSTQVTNVRVDFVTVDQYK